MAERTSFGDMPRFDAFYDAINRRSPFPWQSRLAAKVAETEAWPREVGVPTGLGKTACLEIAIWWLASQAHRAPGDRTAPTRIWWLVNRRLLVDSTFEHALTIKRALRDPGECDISGKAADVVHTVAERLRSLASSPAAEPLEVIRLRGGIASHRARDPSRPTVLLSTLPMYGSRLLFRGYGSSRSMRPVDAALAGTDSLVLVDEAHLARHLTRLLPTLTQCTAEAQQILGGVRSRPQAVALTATGDASVQDRFDLDEEDQANSIVRTRLEADKPLELRIESGDAGLRLAEAARDLLSATRPAACLVFANTPATARSVLGHLQSMFPRREAALLLLTGRTREREAGRTRERILDPVEGMAAKRDHKLDRKQHLIVVATQTLEVGADIDAEYLVTEACGVRALTQRLGRLNRLGHFPNARAVYVHLPAPRRKGQKAGDPDQWPVYGREPATVLRRLQTALDQTTPTVSLSPRHISGILGEPGDDPGRAPELMHGLLWEWVKTTTPPEGAAPVEPYFSGVSDGSGYTVSLMWRAHLPEEGERLWPRATDVEAVDVPIADFRRALDGDEEIRRIGPDGVTIESISGEELRPGDTVVLASDRGLLDEFGWNPDSALPVFDTSVATRGMPLNPDSIRRLCGVAAGELINKALGTAHDHEDIDKAEQAEAIAELIERLRGATPEGWDKSEWDAMVSGLKPEVVSANREVSRLPLKQPIPDELRIDELDERSLSRTGTARDLDLHGRAVGARSRTIAERIGIRSDLIGIIERAGRLHDIGKADRRFQRWLDPAGEGGTAPIAKSDMPRSRWSTARAAAGWPRGGRHEDLSARLVRHWMETRRDHLDPSHADLLIHLIISHHGSGRPIVPPAMDETTETVSSSIEAFPAEASADLSIIDWNQPSRFRELNDRFGPWGLALLETIVRQADHSASAGARIHELEDL